MGPTLATLVGGDPSSPPAGRVMHVVVITICSVLIVAMEHTWNIFHGFQQGNLGMLTSPSLPLFSLCNGHCRDMLFTWSFGWEFKPPFNRLLPTISDSLRFRGDCSVKKQKKPVFDRMWISERQAVCCAASKQGNILMLSSNTYVVNKKDLPNGWNKQLEWSSPVLTCLA